MTKRQAITPAMKIDCLFFRSKITCAICDGTIWPPRDEIEWDHVQALIHGGPHDFTNIRPLHAECHKLKTAKDIKANAKVKRLRGETKTGPKKKIPSRPWPKRAA